MPHIIIEHSRNLTPHIQNITIKLHDYISQCGYFDPQAVKARAIPYEAEILPKGAKNFMHVTLAILEGRSLDERTKLSRNIFALIKDHYDDIDRLSINISEMNKTTYRK